MFQATKYKDNSLIIDEEKPLKNDRGEILTEVN